MHSQFNINTGIYLLLGSFLMVITMVLHPVGGGFEQLLKKAPMAMISHAIAIFSVPFSGLGFLGLSKRLEKDAFFSRLAFATMILGLIAAMLAAAVNGLAQPLFAKIYSTASEETLEAITPIFYYNTALNHAFDYILIGAIFLSVLLWSVAILRTKKLPLWIGYAGMVLVASALLAIVSGFYFLDLHGFRFFIFGWVLWIVFIAVYSFRIGNGKNNSG